VVKTVVAVTETGDISVLDDEDAASVCMIG
jgi:hypothetical protein